MNELFGFPSEDKIKELYRFPIAEGNYSIIVYEEIETGIKLGLTVDKECKPWNWMIYPPEPKASEDYKKKFEQLRNYLINLKPYCNNCMTENCDDCHRKYFRWKFNPEILQEILRD